MRLAKRFAQLRRIPKIWQARSPGRFGLLISLAVFLTLFEQNSCAWAQTSPDVLQQQRQAAAEQRLLVESLVSRGLLSRAQADAINANAAKVLSETTWIHPAGEHEVPGVPGAVLGEPSPASSPSVSSPSPAALSLSASAAIPPPPPASPADQLQETAPPAAPPSVRRLPQASRPSPQPDGSAASEIAELKRELAEQRAEAAAQQQHLVNALVARGVLTNAQAIDLSHPSGMSPGTATQLAQAAQADQAPVDKYKPVPGAMNVPYVPNYVREQIRNQVRQDLVAEAKAGEVTPAAVAPEWTDRLKFYGDVRVRGEYDKFSSKNDPAIIDVNALQSQTYDASGQSGSTPFPYLNTRDDRDRVRLRARLGVDAEIDDGVTAFLRLTTGDTQTPVTQNQTLGNDFNRESFVLDRAGLSFQPYPWVNLSAGRLPNPFMSTTLVWATDLGFDGFDGQFNVPVSDQVGLFGALGGFPLEFTAINTPSSVTAENKPSNFNKWLLAGQVGASYRPDPSLQIKSAVALYDFWNYQGNYDSAPCNPDSAGLYVVCPTDDSHPLFAQNGNTFFALRNLNNALPNVPHPQYFGLASRFNVLDLYTRLDWNVTDPLHLILDLDYAVNLGYNYNRLLLLSQESELFVGNTTNTGRPLSGNQAFSVKVTFGKPEINKLLDWNFGVGYKYLEPDAVVAAFNDPDFHLGGTNAQGYFLTAGLGIAKNTWLNFNWYSASQVMGQPYSVDVLQLDLNARF